jgi:hypothetical protein
VFAAIGSVSGWSCYYYYFCYVIGTGVEWWPAGQPSARPTIDFIASTLVSRIYFMDEDSSGNLWFTFAGHRDGGLGEIINPTSPSWQLSIVEPAGTYQCPGGVYVSNAGAVLNVTDPCTRDTYQYALPLATSGSPTNTLGPTPANSFGQGFPVSGGFNASGTKLILADSYSWLDRGEVLSNKWKAKTNPNVQAPQGAAFTPSDK